MITVVVSICYRVKSVFLLCVFPPDGCSKQETGHRRHACTNDATNDPGLSQSVGSFIISCVRRAFDGRCGVCRKFNLGNFYIPLLNMVIRGEPNHKREKKKRRERNRRRKTIDHHRLWWGRDRCFFVFARFGGVRKGRFSMVALYFDSEFARLVNIFESLFCFYCCWFNAF